MTRPFRLAAAAYPVDRHLSWDAYAAKLQRWVGEAAAGGAALLVFPEYASLELASLDLDAGASGLSAQLRGLQRWAEPYRRLHRDLARHFAVHILAGSFPLAAGGGYRNTALFFTPGGGVAAQEKLIMTRFEREEWGIDPGGDLAVIDSPLGRLGVAVCYDSEFPLLVRGQAEAGARLILVPSCTDTLAGYWRVRVACQARALENQCYVVQAPLLGRADWSAAINVSTGAAGVFGPPDRGFPADGVVALGTLDRPGWLYADIHPFAVDAARADGEVLNHRNWQEQHRLAAARIITPE